MTTRRLLLAVALLMLAVTLAAGFDAGKNTKTSRTPPPRPDRPAPGVTVGATLAPGAARPKRVTAQQGDFVRLRVVGRGPDSVAVQGYDVVETVDADTPAVFEFVAERPGLFPVRFTSDGRVAGVVVVRARGAGR